MKLPKKILLIDDDEINNFIVSEWIKEHALDIQLEVIYNGSLALSYLENCDSENFPDLIICDLRMPGYDGFDFLNQYELLFYQNNLMTQIIIMSANIAEKDMQRLSVYRCLTTAMVKKTVQENFKTIKDNYLK